MVTFTKFGSCVTSDVFNFMNISNYYPKHIYTGINIATAVHKADIPILEEDLVAENGFWEKMQKYCISHEALDDFPKKGMSNFQRRKKENAVIEFAESIVREEMPDIWYINTPENLIADSEHHFGIHPLHFHYIVYEYLAKCVQGIADFDPKGFCSRRKLQVSMDVKEHWLKVKLDELISNYGKNFV